MKVKIITLTLTLTLITIVTCTRNTDLIGKCSNTQSYQFDLSLSRPFTFSDFNYTFPSNMSEVLSFCR